MRTESRRTLIRFLCSMVLFLAWVSPGSAEAYEALKGITSVSTIFDFRDGDPESALLHLKLVHQTYTDQVIRAIAAKPEFVVVFMSSSVKLLSKNRARFSEEQNKVLQEFDQVITAMSKAGIRLEICLFASKVYGVDPASLSKELIPVPNGWISSIGYQKKRYAMIPVY